MDAAAVDAHAAAGAVSDVAAADVVGVADAAAVTVVVLADNCG